MTGMVHFEWTSDSERDQLMWIIKHIDNQVIEFENILMEYGLQMTPRWAPLPIYMQRMHI